MVLARVLSAGTLLSLAQRPALWLATRLIDGHFHHGNLSVLLPVIALAM